MRYTLRALILLMLVLAFLTAVCFAIPETLANGAMTALLLILTGVYAAGATVGPRRTRPFYVAALGALLAGFLFLGTPEEKLQKLAPFYALLDYLYQRTGRHLLDETSIYNVAVMNYFVEASLLLLCSLLSGFICQGVWLLFWKDRENEEA